MKKLYRYSKLALVCASLSGLTGCVEWLHAYQTYLQMNEFDHYFAVYSGKELTVHFKYPKLYSDDFVALARLHASSEERTADGKLWRYLFRKVDRDNKQVKPEVHFNIDLAFNKLDGISDWTFSPLFLQIAPAAFLEASIRSVAGAEINEEKHQLKANAESLEKIRSDLPKKADVVRQLGQPLEITGEEDREVYFYKFLLDTHDIDEGYEDRAVSEVRLSFDKTTSELVRMSGRFAGLKISINYKELQDKDEDQAGRGHAAG